LLLLLSPEGRGRLEWMIVAQTDVPTQGQAQAGETPYVWPYGGAGGGGQLVDDGKQHWLERLIGRYPVRMLLGWLARERSSGTAPRQVAAAATEFVAWPGATALPAFESGELVRTELPVTVLPLLGITDARATRDGRVMADLLIGQDGMVRAVRLAPSDGGQP
jgi:hypothetical protein